MSAVSETIVREYFELNEFLVRQHRKHVGQARTEKEDDIDFFVLNPNPQPLPSEAALPFELGTQELRYLDRAIVVVKGWHTETFYSSRLEQNPEIFRFVAPKVFLQATRAFGKDTKLIKLLVVPALPQESRQRDQSISLLRAKGVDAVIPFRTMLADLVAATEINRNYQKSDLLQIIRILKNYEFFKGPQMELFRAKRRARPEVVK